MRHRHISPYYSEQCHSLAPRWKPQEDVTHGLSDPKTVNGKLTKTEICEQLLEEGKYSPETIAYMIALANGIRVFCRSCTAVLELKIAEKQDMIHSLQEGFVWYEGTPSRRMEAILAR